MVSTHFERVDGWVGMKESEFPVLFEENEFDRMVKQLVNEWLGVDAVFATRLT